MRLFTGLVAIALTQCQPNPTPPPLPPEPIELGATTGTGDRPRLHTIALTLNSPADLKVGEGDSIQAGQIIADRTEDRQRLGMLVNRQRLILDQLRSQQLPDITPPPEPQPPALNIDREAIAIELAQLGQETAQAELTRETALAEATTAIINEHQASIEEHHQAKVTEAQRNHRIAIAQTQAARAALSQKLTDYDAAQYDHAQTQSQAQSFYQSQLLNLARQNQEQQFRIAQMEQAIAQTLDQLAQLETVRSPYPGTVRRVEWLEQSDRRLAARVVVTVRGAGD